MYDQIAADVVRQIREGREQAEKLRAEIERLRAKVAAYSENNDMKHAQIQHAHDEVLRLRAEVTRRELDYLHLDTQAAMLMDERDKLRAAAQQALEALDVGLGAAEEVAERTHQELAGYMPHIHDQVDADVRIIDSAIAALRAT
jgi:chromosome segregation ATPase